ncbi:MAG TPA: hypothetical protein VK166_14920, partial [Chitinophagaceae bacterium]|nr:hypothetical protein [Chitinophagaceae bacterium]
GDLHPRVLGHLVQRPQLEPEPRHQQLRLVAGFAVERDRVVRLEAFAERLDDEADLTGGIQLRV